MRNTLGSLLLGVMLCTVVLASVTQALPIAKITGKATAQPGEIIQLSTEGSSGGPIYAWGCFPKSQSHFFLPILITKGIDSDGNRIFEEAAIFSTLNNGSYAVVLAVAEGSAVDLAVHEIQVGNAPLPPDPIPPGPLPPPVDQKWQVVIVFETSDEDNYTHGQQVLLNSLEFRKSLAKAGHLLLQGGIIDKDIKAPDGTVPAALAPHLNACKGDKLPRLCIAPLEGGDVLDFPLPDTEQGVFDILKQPPATLWRLKEILSRAVKIKPAVEKTKMIWGGPGMKVEVPIDWQPPVYQSLLRQPSFGNPNCQMCVPQ